MPKNKVDFFVVGAQRCGTTFLCDALARLDPVEFSSIKEPFFFTQADDWREEIEDYHNLFCFEEGILNGEGSTRYTMIPKYKPVYEDIYDYNPSAKIIYAIRNPVERAISLFTYYSGGKKSRVSFEESFEKNIEYICAGMYYRQIYPYLENFGKDNVCILTFDDLINNTLDTIEEIADFIGVEDVSVDIQSEKKNSSEGNYVPTHSFSESLYRLYGKVGIHQHVPDSIVHVLKRYLIQTSQRPEISPSLRIKISGFFEDDIRRIESLLDQNLDHWRSPPR